jgi:TetR/AcrR family transcriptional regulator
MPESLESKSGKRTRERADTTRRKLLETAITLFADNGYDGVTLRDIEKVADVHRGLASYHFEDKDSLWKAAADTCLGRMRVEVDHRTNLLNELSPDERLAFIVRFYVRFSARHPEEAALVSQEARRNTWRTQHLIDHHIRPGCDAMEALAGESLGLDRQEFIHWYYILISSSSTIFYFAPECEMLFGVDSRSDEIVERHAELLVDMLVRSRQAQ